MTKRKTLNNVDWFQYFHCKKKEFLKSIYDILNSKLPYYTFLKYDAEGFKPYNPENPYGEHND